MSVILSLQPKALGVESIDPWGIATQTFLRMSDVIHTQVEKSILECTLQNGYKRFFGFKNIVEEVRNTINIDSLLDNARKSEIEAYVSMIDHNLYSAIVRAFLEIHSS